MIVHTDMEDQVFYFQVCMHTCLPTLDFINIICYNIQPTSMWCSCFISLETEIVIFTIKEGDNLVLPCASWKKCYNGYRPKNHFFYQLPSKRACSPTNCRDYPSGSGIIDYERNFFGVMIMNISRDHSGLWTCRIKDNETNNWYDLRRFRVEVTHILGTL